MANFRSLENLRQVLRSTRGDLAQVRDIDAKLRLNLATLSSQRQFTPEHIRQEAGKLRRDAREMASLYLHKEQTLSLLASVTGQAEQWTVPGFLAHASSETATNDTNALLRRLISQASLPRTTTASLATDAQAAADRSDWTALGVIHREAQFRAAAGDESASALVAGIASVQPPEIEAAKQLIAEARQVEELLTYTQRSIESGQEDLGVKNERWHAEAAERRAAQRA